MIEFTASDVMRIQSIMSVVFYVPLDQETSDFAHLRGQRVKVTWRGRTEEVAVRAIERFAHCPPYKKGEEVGLVVNDYENPFILPPRGGQA